MRRLFLALCTFTLFVAVSLSGQGQIRVNTNLVVVPVTVRGADGELVTGLTKDDFTVLEDGQPQTITNFDTEPAPLSAAIVVDDGIAGIALHRVASLLFAIAANIEPVDEVSVFRYDRSVDRLSDFSKDPKVMQKSFDRIAEIAKSHPEEQHELITGGPGWLRSILGIFPDGSKGSSRNHVLHNAVYDAAMALKGRPAERRRVLFLISDGEVSGPANTHSLAQNTELLLKNDIQVFAVSTTYASFGSSGVLTSYAEATGGDVYSGATDSTMEHAFNNVIEQARRQYVIGYFSSNRNSLPGVMRKIEVKTSQPKQKVTYRKGYMR